MNQATGQDHGTRGPREMIALTRGTPLESVVEAALIRAEPLCASPIRRLDGPGAVLIIAEGTGDALTGDVWLPVQAGDRVALGQGDEYAIRAIGEPLTALLLWSKPGSARQDHAVHHPAA